MIRILIIILMPLLLVACAPSDLHAPCPHYGFWCHKTPINGWSMQR